MEEKCEMEYGIGNEVAAYMMVGLGNELIIKMELVGGRDLGCHIDGFVAVVAHTHMLCDGPITGRAADALMACHTAAEVALRLVRPGRKVVYSYLQLGFFITSDKFQCC
jgi:hypothetical protein